MSTVPGAGLLALAERCEAASEPGVDLFLEVYVAVHGPKPERVHGGSPELAQYLHRFNPFYSLITHYAWLDAAMSLYLILPERVPSNPRLAAAEALRQRAEASHLAASGPSQQEAVSALRAPLANAAALISPCGLYRYWLTREWDARCFKLPIIMLNPSTADARIDDPTIRRCMAFAKREGFGGIRVMNLFAFRATSPDDMRAAIDPIGPGNDDGLNKMLRHAAREDLPVLAAWGAHGDYRRRSMMIRSFATLACAQLVCLGTTKDGHPRHPLYVKGDQPFVPFGAQNTPASKDLSL